MLACDFLPDMLVTSQFACSRQAFEHYMQLHAARLTKGSALTCKALAWSKQTESAIVADDADSSSLTGVHAQQFTTLPCQLQVGASRGG